jgi:omega-6 fatty acid desaturase (delta-12 desaturase)
LTIGFGTVLFYYIVPFFVVNYHIVLISYLQHTDVFLPHFRGAQWNWLRGSMATVDRSFGPVLDHILHHVVDTHVCHHLFPSIPFYHAQEATESIREVLGPFYVKDETAITKALWRVVTICKFVEDGRDIVFFKNMQ